jgi:ZIP family zinc transporter
MGGAFLWGVVAGASLVLGGVIALRVSLSQRLLGLIMAFGAGVLISAVAYELVDEALTTSAGDGGVGLGLLAGSAVFFGAEVMIDRLSTRRNTSTSTSANDTRAAETGRAVTLGIILDGIPESLVLGLTVLETGTVSVALLVAVFIANIPEAIAATTAFARAGRHPTRIIRFWILVGIGFGVTSLAGYVVLDSASPRTVAIVLAFAGGAVLTMLANTMMPEALHHGGKLAGFVTTVGFALAFAISAVH